MKILNSLLIATALAFPVHGEPQRAQSFATLLAVTKAEALVSCVFSSTDKLMRTSVLESVSANKLTTAKKRVIDEALAVPVAP